MSDSATEETMPDPAPAIPEAASSPSSSTSKDDGLSPLATLLLRLWSAIMIVCTTVLSFYVFVLKDNSVIPFVVLGIIGLCLPPAVNALRAMARNKRLRLELEERIRQAELERIQEARERELERQKQAQIMEKQMEEQEAAEHEAIKNIDVEAYKINNSMQ